MTSTLKFTTAEKFIAIIRSNFKLITKMMFPNYDTIQGFI